MHHKDNTHFGDHSTKQTEEKILKINKQCKILLTFPNLQQCCRGEILNLERNLDELNLETFKIINNYYFK